MKKKNRIKNRIFLSARCRKSACLHHIAFRKVKLKLFTWFSATRWRCFHATTSPTNHPSGLAEVILSEKFFFIKIFIIRNLHFQMHFSNVQTHFDKFDFYQNFIIRHFLFQMHFSNIFNIFSFQHFITMQTRILYFINLLFIFFSTHTLIFL